VGDGVVYFPEGLPGFESLTRFVLLREDDLLPVVLLCSLTEPSVSCPIVPIQCIEKGYELRLNEDDCAVLGLAGPAVVGQNVQCLAIVSLGDGTRPASANLFAPIVISLEILTAKQVIQFESNYAAVAEV